MRVMTIGGPPVSAGGSLFCAPVLYSMPHRFHNLTQKPMQRAAKITAAYPMQAPTGAAPALPQGQALDDNGIPMSMESASSFTTCDSSTASIWI